MARKSYTLDGVVIGEQADFSTIATGFSIATFGFISSVSVSIEDEVKQVKTIKGGSTGHKYDRNVDMLHKVTGEITFIPVDLKFLEYFLGNYAEPSGYTVASQNSVPTFLTFKGNYDGTKSLRIIGVVFNDMTIKISEGNMLEVSAKFSAREVATATETITYTPPTEDPITYLNGSFTHDSNAYKVNDLSISCSLGTVLRRSVEATSSGDKRLYTEAVRTTIKPTVNGTCDLEATTNEIEGHLGGTAVQDSRSDVNLVLTLTDAGGDSHTLTVTGFRSNKFDKMFKGGEEEEVKTFTFSGPAIDISAAGAL